MNYDHSNKIYEFYRNRLSSYFIHQFQAASFEDYLKKFSFLQSGKWLRDMEKIKISRIVFPIDPEKLAKKFSKQCVTYNAPAKPEDGLQRVIYQLSPTLHFETAFWAWIEHDIVQSYATILVCYNDDSEFDHFQEIVWKMRREGNTEDKPLPTGFNPTSVGFGT